MEEELATNKIILLPSIPKKIITNEETRKKRKITEENCWKTGISIEIQKQMIQDLYTKEFSHLESPSEQNSIIKKQIYKKIAGYKQQDIQNGIYSESEFVTFNNVVELLHDSQLTCYYCQNPIELLYEYVRELTQWTLERLNNKKGHNPDNVVIACLGCNLRRRTMYHERFLFTKQIVKQNIIKLS
jgi:5-methylcytosine-specific restriction endonuclease McrA